MNERICEVALDATDRAILNRMQDGMPLCSRPFQAVAEEIGVTESDLIARLERMQRDGAVTRVGPMYNAERMGGAFSLVAMRVPPEAVDEVAAVVNAFPEVAHHYERAHAFNLWFVLAVEQPERIDAVCRAIAEQTGYPVYNLPKLKEFFVGLRFPL